MTDDFRPLNARLPVGEARGKLALGTVQFGLDYGVSNRRGKIPEAEAMSILEAASDAGMDTIDTAHAYGDSEPVIGRSPLRGRFRIVSKLPPCSSRDASSRLEESLSRLRVDSLYGCLFHDFTAFEAAPDAWDVLQTAVRQGTILHPGFSLYDPSQLESILAKGLSPGIVQVPFNIFDRRFEPLFPELKRLGWEIHVRSVFLQGLFFLKPQDLRGPLAKAGPKLAALGDLSRESGLPIQALCLGLAAANAHVDRIVVGLESRANLDDDLAAYAKREEAAAFLPRLSALREDDEDVILPSRWKA